MSEALLNQAAYFLQRGDLWRAEATYREVLTRDPLNFEACDALATILAQRGRAAEAASFFELALKMKPDDAIAHSNYGGVLDALGRRQEALEHYERALAIQERALGPDHPNVALTLELLAQAQKRSQEPRAKGIARLRDPRILLRSQQRPGIRFDQPPRDAGLQRRGGVAVGGALGGHE